MWGEGWGADGVFIGWSKEPTWLAGTVFHGSAFSDHEDPLSILLSNAISIRQSQKTSVSVSLPAPLSLSLSLYLCHWTGLPASQGKWNSPTFHIHSPSSCSLYHAPKHAINAYSKYHMVYYQQTLKLLKTLKITNFKTYKINQTTYKLIRIFILKKKQGIFKNLN